MSRKMPIDSQSRSGTADGYSWMKVCIVLECHRCGVEIDQEKMDAADWDYPAFVRLSDSWLQTQFCAQCAPLSLGRWLRRRNNKWPRWIHRLYANTHGYFWLPCPVCGKMFGGHEKGGDLDLGYGRGKMTCGCNRAISPNDRGEP
jgi:hypothetical protein